MDFFILNSILRYCNKILFIAITETVCPKLMSHSPHLGPGPGQRTVSPLLFVIPSLSLNITFPHLPLHLISFHSFHQCCHPPPPPLAVCFCPSFYLPTSLPLSPAPTLLFLCPPSPPPPFFSPSFALPLFLFSVTLSLSLSLSP